MNKRWQDYNNQREAYVKTLLTESNDLKKRVEELSGNQGNVIPQEIQIEMNRILDEARRLTRELDEQKKSTSRAHSERDRVSLLLVSKVIIITLLLQSFFSTCEQKPPHPKERHNLVFIYK